MSSDKGGVVADNNDSIQKHREHCGMSTCRSARVGGTTAWVGRDVVCGGVMGLGVSYRCLAGSRGGYGRARPGLSVSAGSGQAIQDSDQCMPGSVHVLCSKPDSEWDLGSETSCQGQKRLASQISTPHWSLMQPPTPRFVSADALLQLSSLHAAGSDCMLIFDRRRP